MNFSFTLDELKQEVSFLPNAEEIIDKFRFCDCVELAKELGEELEAANIGGFKELADNSIYLFLHSSNINTLWDYKILQTYKATKQLILC